MRALAMLCGLCALGGGVAASAVAGADAADRAPASAAVGSELIAEIHHFKSVTWHWQKTMGVPVTRTAGSAVASPDLTYRQWVLDLWKRRATRVQQRAARWLVLKAAEYRLAATHWQKVMGARTAPTRSLASAAGGTLRERESRMLEWRRRATALLRKAQSPPRHSAWLCIHRFEGSWTDGGGPYYGGLQMDLSFQRHYGSYLLRTKGTADKWTPLEQIWVAERAYRSGRGFYPWPNTARACGLI
jgi:hypothetical protein